LIVWLRDRTSAHEFLRIGRLAVERWASPDGKTLTQQAECPLGPAHVGQPDSVSAAISTLYPAAPSVPVTLLLESAWMPVMLVDTGTTLLRAAEVDALVRHRFGLYHSDGLDPVSSWELRIEHRVGERDALACGLSPRLKQSLLAVAQSLNMEWAALMPAFGWGLDRLRPAKAWTAAGGWWLWPEQDRTFIARLTPRGVIGLNPSAVCLVDEAGLTNAVQAEGVRLGVTSSIQAIAAATWDEIPRLTHAGAQFSWLSIRGQRGLQAPIRSLATLSLSLIHI
jgi:hypothetical protein